MDPKHDQTTNEAPPSRKPKQSGAPEPQAEMKIRKPEEDVLNVIESVESQLGALRKAHEEHRQAMQALHEQKNTLEAEREELESREQELTNREVELAEMRQEFEHRELNLVQRASGLEQRESKLAAQAESLEQQEAELESRSSEIQRKIAELDEQLSGLSKRKSELDALEQEALEKLSREEEAAAKLEIATAELEELRPQLSERSERLATMESELEKLRADHEKSTSELKSTVSKLRGREIELGERSKALEELAEKAGNIEHELSDARSEFEQKLKATEQSKDELQQQLTREKQVSTGLRAQIETLEHQQTTGDAEAQKHVAELQGKLTEREQQLEEALAKVQSIASSDAERSEQDQARINELTSELESTKKQLEEVNAQLGSIGADADEELTKQREQSEQLTAQVESLKAELEKATIHAAELQKQVDAGGEADPEEMAKLRSDLQEAGEQRDELVATVEKRESQLKELIAKVGELESELAEARENGGESSGEIDEATSRKIESLETQCSELIATVEKLNTELERAREQGAGGTAAPVNDEWSSRRRQRLQRMRKVLKGDAEKVRLATEALRTRYEQCEQVLTKRAELAEAYEAIAAAQRKYRNKEVRSGVLIGLFGMIAITVMVGVCSWFVAGRVAPGMYSSRATMAAISSEGQLSDADLTQWEAYITQLTEDPRFLEVAAERMKRRGISAFETPGELGTHMKDYLDVVASMPGEVTLEYRDIGAERAQRVLDTFTVALSSAANNARARMVDTAKTSVEESASLTSEPLDTKRLEMSGMIFGGTMVLTLIVGGVIWRRLAAAKARFEKDSRVEVLYDEEEWKLPTA